MIFEKSFVNYEREAHEIENASKRPNRELFINNLLIDWLERLSGRSLIVISIARPFGLNCVQSQKMREIQTLDEFEKAEV